MSPAAVARLLATVPTVRDALAASERARASGQYDLADGLWCHAAALRTTGYQHSREGYARDRDRILAALPEPEEAP